jgi:hypothetical protein
MSEGRGDFLSLFTWRTVAEKCYTEAVNALASIGALVFRGIAYRHINLTILSWK